MAYTSGPWPLLWRAMPALRLLRLVRAVAIAEAGPGCLGPGIIAQLALANPWAWLFVQIWSVAPSAVDLCAWIVLSMRPSILL